MQKLLTDKKTDLLQFVSTRTRRPFSAYLVVQGDGKVGFEFAARDPAKGARTGGRRGATALRVLGPHPKDRSPVELHDGRYGPYVKHGAVNATLPDRDRAPILTLDEAVALLAAKNGPPSRAAAVRTVKAPLKRAARTTAAVEPVKPATKRAAGKRAAVKGLAPSPAQKRVAKRPVAKRPVVKKTTVKNPVSSRRKTPRSG